jgi:predicted aspartyl protease
VTRGVLVLLLVLATAPPAAAELFRWTAADGVVHYTSDPESIPEAYRASAVDIGAPTARPAPATPPAAAGVVLPFSGGAPVVVQARLNGVGLSLLLDTGADRTVIAPAALTRAGIDPALGTPIRITGVTGSAAATLVAVPLLDVAGARVGPLSVIVHAVPSDSLDGLLGRDVLDAFTVTFDAAAGRVTLLPR